MRDRHARTLEGSRGFVGALRAGADPFRVTSPGRRAKSAFVKLDDLRARLRKGIRAPKKKPPKLKRRRRCSKCRRALEPASLTDPDVAEIVAEEKPPPNAGPASAAYRCRECRRIWITYPILTLPPMHTNCRSS